MPVVLCNLEVLLLKFSQIKISLTYTRVGCCRIDVSSFLAHDLFHLKVTIFSVVHNVENSDDDV